MKYDWLHCINVVKWRCTSEEFISAPHLHSHSHSHSHSHRKRPTINVWMDRWRRPLISRMKLSSITRKFALSYRTLVISIVCTRATPFPDRKSWASFNIRILNLIYYKTHFIGVSMWACHLHIVGIRLSGCNLNRLISSRVRNVHGCICMDVLILVIDNCRCNCIGT